MTTPRHECPEDPSAFFHVLFMNITYGRGEEAPEGYAECLVCGTFYKRETARTVPTGEGEGR